MLNIMPINPLINVFNDYTTYRIFILLNKYVSNM